MNAVTCPLSINGFSSLEARPAAVARRRRVAEAVAEIIYPNDAGEAVNGRRLVGC